MGRSTFGKVAELMASVMDLHVRLALQEASRERRRLIGGAVFLAMGFSLATFAGVAAQLALVLWLHGSQEWSWLQCVLAVAGLDLALSGLLLRIGGGMLKGPFLPETRLGISRTTRALTGRF